MEAVFLIGLGFLIGILAGLLGIGGGILMVPALIFLPPMWGHPSYGIYEATGISAVQALMAGISGAYAHAKKHAVDTALLMPLALGSVLGGFLGGLVSGMVSELVLYALFESLLLLQLMTILLFAKKATPMEAGLGGQKPVGWVMGGVIGVGVGLVAANTGVGGALILLPILIYLFHVPTRLAIGTGAAFVVFTAASASLGKWMMGLIPLEDAFLVSLGSLAGGYIGGILSHKLPVAILQKLLLMLVLLAFIRILFQIIALL